MSGQKTTNYHVMNTVWDGDYPHNQTPTNIQYNGYRSPDPKPTVNNAKVQSYVTLTQPKRNQRSLDDGRVYSVDMNEPTSPTSPTRKDPSETMVNWTQQLQEQLKRKNSRETSASSTKQLIHSTDSQ